MGGLLSRKKNGSFALLLSRLRLPGGGGGKVAQYILLFYQIRNTLPTDTAIQIFYSFIYSQLSYTIEIYGTAITTFLNPLQILQNRLIKLLTMKPRRFSTKKLYLEYNLLKIKDIHLHNIGGIVLKYCNGIYAT